MSNEPLAASAEPQPARRRRLWLALLPLAIFLGLAGVFLIDLISGRDASIVPSALIGAQAPDDPLPPVEGLGLPGIDPKAFIGRVTVLNVFASWCVPCRDEHPIVMTLANDPRITLVGLNYKDAPEQARAFLGEVGNPYAAVGADRSGRAAIDWGVYGVPETFVVGKDGRIAFKQVGPLDDAKMRTALMPAIGKAVSAP